MKRTLSSLMIAGMLVNAVPSITSMDVVSAAQISQETKVKASSQYLFVDGMTQKISAIQVKGKTLYSAKEIAKNIQAKFTYDKKTKTYTLAGNGRKITFKRDANYIISNNKKIALSAPTTVFNSQTYINLEPVVSALGGDVITNNVTNVKFISSKGLAVGSFSDAKWINDRQILFTSENSNAYLFDVKTKKIVKQFSIEEMVTSPDGKKAVYTDENGFVYLLDFKTGNSTQISNDESFKTEFKWVADGTKVFFLQGDKSETISSISVADGTITKILDDKVEYKSDLIISADGSKVLYTAAKQAVTKYTDDTKSEVDTIITDGTEPQIYLLNTTIQVAKPVVISSSIDNKFFTTILPDGNFLYLSVDAENEEKLPELKMVQADSLIENTLLSSKQIDLFTVTAKGSVYLLVTEDNDTSSVYKMDIKSKKLERLLNTTQAVTTIDVSKNEKQIIVTVSTDKGEKITILKNGSLEALTKN